MKYLVTMIPTDGSHTSSAYAFDTLEEAQKEFDLRVDFYHRLYDIYLSQEIKRG